MATGKDAMEMGGRFHVLFADRLVSERQPDAPRPLAA